MTFNTAFKRFLADESGASMAEYALLLGVIAVALVGAMSTFKGKIATSLETAGNAMTTPS